ncbi:GIY-YIG nuclease family protein [Lactobacillus johnsonii]|uniref:GIY-YIG nuclease family protein n=1 Tax=Lactobacillus johnsonii TaxID=33959 RepID=UPI0028E2BDB5|nr:GIY-YIG nuclease family protein [Lactobacillus johnsonii]MDT9605178.1 GIY-YIG nuclease family protein [Lactobacillus johnsonii]
MSLLKENERIDYIYSDDRQIIQAKDAFSVTLDSLFLGYFAQQKVRDKDKIVDLCSGNGAVSLYMSCFNRAHYDAIEIQPEIADQAQRSVELNKLENRITVHNFNALEAPKKLKKDYYDMVVVNPPYFKVPEGHVINPDEKKALARHEIAINLEQIVKVSSDLLKMKGKMYMVHRPERLGEIMHYCLKYDLSPKWVQPFVSKKGEKSNLILVEATKHTGSDGLVLEDSIEVHEQDGQFKPEIQKIIKEPKDRENEVKEKYYFYCLLCADGSFYGGFTNDLKHRLEMHNAGKGAKYTKARRPVKMIYHEEFDDKKLALKREYWFKHHSRTWKEKFLRDHNVKF